jgi:hypothetical protein
MSRVMTISKNKFGLLLFFIFIFPFLLHKMIWLINSKKTTAEMCFMGRTLEVQGTSDHAVLRFTSGGKKVFFNANFELDLKPGAIVYIRYQKNDPTDARVNSFTSIWLDTFLYIIPQLLILSILFFTPGKWDPLIPANAKIAFGRKPLIRIIAG